MRRFIPKPIADKLRAAKAEFFALTARRKMASRSARPPSKKGLVIILSLGGREGSPILAKSVADLGYDIHVFAPKFPSYEGQYARGWSKIDPINDIDGAVAAARALSPKAALVEIRNILLPAKLAIHEALNLRKFSETATIASNSKIEMRRILEKTDIEQLRWSTYDEYQHGSLGYPVIVKPERGTGSRGVIQASNEEEVLAAVKLNKQFEGDVIAGGEILIEEFIDGPNYDVTGIFRDGTVYPFVVQLMKFKSIDGALPATWYLLNPKIEPKLRKLLLETCRQHLVGLGVEVGAFTCEMRLASNGKLYITDFGNRCATPPSVSRAAGQSLTEVYAQAMIEDNFEPPVFDYKTVFQHFVRDPDQLKKYDSLIQKYPHMVTDARRLRGSYAGVPTLARIALIAPDYPTMTAKLDEFGLLTEDLPAV